MTSLIAIGPFATASGLLAELGALIQAAGLLQALVLAVFGGLLTCLTPCVYPLIPITLSIFGACGAKSSRQAFLLSLAYVLGIAITYSILGLLAAASGSVFGSLLGNPWVIGAICGCLIFLSIYNLDLLTFSLGQGLSRFANSLGGKGYRGAFVMGMASGIVAAPCVGPVLLSILVIAAASGSAWKGGLLLFFYALGFGCPF